MLDSFFGLFDVLGSGQGLPGNIGRRFQSCQHFSYLDRHAGVDGFPSEGGCCRPLVGHRRRRHLAAGHPIYGVVDKNGRKLFTPIGGVHDFAHSDTGQIAVALIGENHQIRSNPLNPGSHGGCPAMGGLLKVKGEIVVHQDGTADRRYAYGAPPDTELVDHLCYQPVCYSMGTTRTVMRNRVCQGFRFLKCFSHFRNSYILTIFRTSSITSSGVGTSPPHLPYQ